jgi:hypothetical protein
MILIKAQCQLDAMPASDLKSHLQARYRTLYEDNFGPVFGIVEDDDITGLDYAFIGNQGLLSDLFEEHEPGHPEFARPYEWVSYIPELELYEALLLINNEDGYWIIIPESIVETHPDLKWVLTDDSQGGLSAPQPLY